MIKLINLLKESLREDQYELDYDYPEDSNEYEKVTPETIKKINSNDRIVLGTEDKIDLSRSIPPSRIWMKPIGLWYGFGTSWIDFIRAEMPERETEHVFKIEIDTSNVLIIKDEKSFLEFSNKYKDPENEGRFGNHKINWPEVTKIYKGIEFPEYFSKYRGDPEHDWYSNWDIESGCIWNLTAIKKIDKLQ